MELHLKITGIVLIILALVHIVFPRYFDWKGDFKTVSLINKQMMYVHAFFVAVTVLLMGLLCVYCTEDLVHTRLGKQISLGLFIFWALRLIFQFVVYSPKLWKGKRFETIMHIVFSLLWVYVTVVFLLISISE
jgi:hypothetical protein